MLRQIVFLVLAAGIFWLAVDNIFRDQHNNVVSGSVPQPVQPTTEPEPELEPIAPPGGEAKGLVADINVHTVEELSALFDRVEQGLERPRTEGEVPLISLVLHGPEVEFFALKNYAHYKGIVDRAAKLAALGGVQINICRTQMKTRGIGVDEVPSFLNQVPYGPGEVERLIGSGYVYM